MAGNAHKKRHIDGRLQRPSKKQKRQREYNSDAESEQGQDQFDAVDLLDSDDDIHNATVEDAAAADDDSSSSDQDASNPAQTVMRRQKPKGSKAPAKRRSEVNQGQGDDSEEDAEEDEQDDSDVDESDRDLESAGRKPKSKRNDPSAFANSLSKILSTKLSSSKRTDPVLARSAEAHQASKAAVDGALEAKARRHLKEQKRRALEKGRVKDVLLATNSDLTGEPETSTAEVLQTERKLREVAKRGVIKMFNAVRAAQAKAAEAEKDAKKAGVIGINRREEKVNELSKKGFLDLIASGGGGLKKGGLEEA